MGYRSEVRIMIYDADATKMNAFIAAATLKGYWDKFDCDGKQLMLRTVEGDEHKAMLMVEYFGDGVKWYDTYEDVQAMEHMLELAGTMGVQYEFIRLGEDIEDIDIRRSDEADYYLSISRHIHACYNEITPEENNNV